MRTFLITGSAGFIGSYLLKKIISNKNNFVYSYDRKQIKIKSNNLRHEVVDLKYKKKFPVVDYVIHLAAFNGTKFFYKKPLEVINDNIQSTMNILNFYNKKKCKLFVYAGSPESIAGATDYFKMTVPSLENYPVVIEDITNPRWSYGLTKAVGELAVANSRLPYIIIRYHNVYGPGQKDHFVSDFIERILKNKQYILNGHNDSRSFMYIDDAIDATMKIIQEKKCLNQIINVGSKNEQKILSVAKKIMKILGHKKKLKLNNSPIGSVKRRCPNINKLIKFTKHKDLYTLEQGLKKTIASYKK